MDEDAQQENHGCFYWVLRAGRTINERFAKSRNRLREMFHGQYPEKPSLRPQDLLNDTGTPDMHLVKVSVAMETSKFGAPAIIYKKRQTVREEPHETTCTRDARLIQSDDGLAAQRTTDDQTSGTAGRAIQDMRDFAKLYVAGIIRDAEAIMESQTGCGDINQSVKDVESHDMSYGSNCCDFDSCASVHGSSSWNSSIISDTAETTVNYTLERVVALDYTCDEKQNVASDAAEKINC